MHIVNMPTSVRSQFIPSLCMDKGKYALTRKEQKQVETLINNEHLNGRMHVSNCLPPLYNIFASFSSFANGR